MDDLLQNPDINLLDLKRSVLKIKRAAEISSDASQDAIQLCANVQVANIIIRNIWLKHWKVDSIVQKQHLIRKILGRRLFGESNLVTVLIETKKGGGMPSSSTSRDKHSKARSHQSFCSFRPSGQGRYMKDCREF